MTRLLAAFAVVIALVALLAAFGPRPSREETVRFDPAMIGADIDAWLTAREAEVANVKDGAQKGVVWADPATKSKTPLALVYIHGFSATRREISPVVENAAAQLGANAFFTRLAGHGRDSAAMAEATMNDWVDDLAQAMEIGRRIGERVVLVGTSTGGTLATLAAARPGLASDLAAIVLISPNYALPGVSTGLLNMPWAETILPLVFGANRSFEPHNEQQAQWWTTSYPSSAVFPMAALLATVDSIDYGRIATPALFIFSPNDKVIDPMQVRNVHSKWGGPKELLAIEDAGDPSSHVIAGDILSPATTGRTVEAIVAFLRSVK